MFYEEPSLTKLLHDKSTALGFELFGVAPVQNVPELALFEKWLAQDYAGEMAYLANNSERRTDPRTIVKNAKSVIICGANYHTDAPLSTQPADADAGWIARYALGDDYHDVLKKRVKSLYEYLVSITEGRASGRYYVDTGPVLEKVWAKYAGVGWIGKNTCLINKERGSFFFLGAIITDTKLHADQPAVDHCGSCTRCLDACPTDALVEPYVLDANLCISYLTIEKRGAIPEAMRDRMGRHLFGCDICQDVCPWNRKATPTRDTAFQPRDGFINPPLADILSLDEARYRDRFRRSPIKRAKLRGLLRNAIIAAGNSGVKKLISSLQKFLTDQDEVLREHAEWAIRKLREMNMQKRQRQQ